QHAQQFRYSREILHCPKPTANTIEMNMRRETTRTNRRGERGNTTIPLPQEGGTYAGDLIKARRATQRHRPRQARPRRTPRIDRTAWQQRQSSRAPPHLTFIPEGDRSRSKRGTLATNAAIASEGFPRTPP
ncbi:unnamed protein product, partial [Laminaria digitata]